MRRCLTVILLTAIAACGGTEEGADSTGDSGVGQTTATATSASPATTTSSRSLVPTQTSTSSTSPITTTNPATTTTATTTTSTALGVAIELRADGIGNLEFGDSTDAVMESLVALLGPPSSGEEYPYGAHPLRYVYWEDLGLAVVFSDYAFFRDDGVEHFAGWAHGRYVGDLAGSDYGTASWTLRTATEVGIGSTLADLQSAYGDQLVLDSACDPGGPLNEAYVRGEVSSIRFLSDDQPLGPTSRVIAMTAGAGPGC